MRRRQAIATLVLAGLVLVVFVNKVLFAEPRYAGRNLSAWLADLDLESSHSGRAAVCAVQAIGTNAFPMLTAMIRSTDSWWKQKIMALNAGQPVFGIPVTPASVFRNRAVQGYVALGGRAKQNVPELIRLFEKESSCQVRSSIAAALGGIGPEAKGAVPLLIKATQDSSAEVRKESVWALANIRGWSNRSL